MAEQVERWWERRQWSRGVEVPYPVGTYREAWAPYPMLIRQYHPEFNAGITLTQIPPAAEVWLLWQCDVGASVRRDARRAALATARSAPPLGAGARSAHSRRIRRASGSIAVPNRRRARPARCASARRPRMSRSVSRSPAKCAPRPASAVEAQLRADLLARLDTTPGLNAVRVRRPFFDHLEVWPDIVLPELRIAIEYDTTGRFGLEHVGIREASDRRKDRALRAARWEVVRIRTGKLEKLGPWDLQLSALGRRGLDRVIDTLRDIRGTLFVDAYLR